jgi:uncharacterized protein YuzE
VDSTGSVSVVTGRAYRASRRLSVRLAHVNVSYCRIAEGKIDRTAEATESTLVDADGKVLGVEVIGDGNWVDGLAALAMKGRLRVVPASARQLACKRPQLA